MLRGVYCCCGGHRGYHISASSPPLALSRLLPPPPPSHTATSHGRPAWPARRPLRPRLVRHRREHDPHPHVLRLPVLRPRRRKQTTYAPHRKPDITLVCDGNAPASSPGYVLLQPRRRPEHQQQQRRRGSCSVPDGRRNAQGPAPAHEGSEHLRRVRAATARARPQHEHHQCTGKEPQGRGI